MSFVIFSAPFLPRYSEGLFFHDQRLIIFHKDPPYWCSHKCRYRERRPQGSPSSPTFPANHNWTIYVQLWNWFGHHNPRPPVPFIQVEYFIGTIASVLPSNYKYFQPVRQQGMICSNVESKNFAKSCCQLFFDIHILFFISPADLVSGPMAAIHIRSASTIFSHGVSCLSHRPPMIAGTINVVFYFYIVVSLWYSLQSSQSSRLLRRKHCFRYRSYMPACEVICFLIKAMYKTFRFFFLSYILLPPLQVHQGVRHGRERSTHRLRKFSKYKARESLSLFT